MVEERIIYITGYHDGPIGGFSGDLISIRFFRCIFDNITDEYSDMFQVVDLTNKEQETFKKLFCDEHVVRGRPSVDQQVFFNNLNNLLAEDANKTNGRVHIYRAKIVALIGGSSGSYKVTWEKV